MAEKTEKPTDKRRKESAQKGQAFKSKDLITTVTLIASFYFIYHFINFRQFIEAYTQILLHGGDINLKDFMIQQVKIFFNMVLPLIAVCVIAGGAVTLLQTRFLLATKALKLNFKALNPVSGFKKIFSWRSLKELVKAACYLIVFGCTANLFIHDDLRGALSFYRADIARLIPLWGQLVMKMVLTFMALSLIVLLADYIVEFFLHFKDLKMDKHEVKQERKESEGNPLIKSARRRIHHEILSGEDKAAIRNSAVVMANPTHIAMAIYFNPEMAAFPFIVLRVTNMKARAAIAYAEKTGIPVVRNVALTRRLFHHYRQYSFISLQDDSLAEIMDILIWLRQVEAAGMTTHSDSADYVQREE